MASIIISPDAPGREKAIFGDGANRRGDRLLMISCSHWTEGRQHPIPRRLRSRREARRRTKRRRRPALDGNGRAADEWRTIAWKFQRRRIWRSAWLSDRRASISRYR